MYSAIELLVVDDSPGDIRLYQEFFKMNKFRNSINYLSSTGEMLDYLGRERLPDIILLSMHLLAAADNVQILQEIKSEPRFQAIPLVALTSSTEEQTMLEDIAAYIKHYICKPLDIDNLYSLLSHIENLGLVIARGDAELS